MLSAERWVTESDVGRVASVRRAVAAYAARNGAAGVLLADVAIAVSEVLTSAALHGGPADAITTTAEVRDGELVVIVRGAGVGLTSDADTPAVRMGMLVAAALAREIRFAPAADAGREVCLS